MISIKIYSDYIWPFCYIGEGVVNQLKKEYELDVEWLGLEIHPETPLSGVDTNSLFGQKTVESTIINLNRMGAEFGLKFGKLKHMPNSHNALEAAEFARSKGKLTEFHHLLMEEYFTHGKDIGLVHNLCEIGNRVGLNSDDLKTAITEKSFKDKLEKDAINAHKYNIRSTPTFIVDNKHLIVGAQGINTFRKLLDEINSSNT